MARGVGHLEALSRPVCPVEQHLRVLQSGFRDCARYVASGQDILERKLHLIAEQSFSGGNEAGEEV